MRMYSNLLEKYNVHVQRLFCYLKIDFNCLFCIGGKFKKIFRISHKNYLAVFVVKLNSVLSLQVLSMVKRFD